MHWKVFHASVTGRQHLEAGQLGQDASCVQAVGAGFVAAVCDGAGSAPEGGTGARLVAAALCEELAQCAAPAPDEDLRAAVARVRGRLEACAQEQGRELRDFACTVVACLLGAQEGVFLHLGDGHAFCTHGDGSVSASHPENGEYSDETYFLSDPQWSAHLRLLRFAAPEGIREIGLLSDGAAPFAVNRSRDAFYRPFMDPVTDYLRGCSPESGNAALAQLLGREQAQAISGDDKSLVLALPA